MQTRRTGLFRWQKRGGCWLSSDYSEEPQSATYRQFFFFTIVFGLSLSRVESEPSFISFGQMSATLSEPRNLDNVSWREWHTLAKRAIMNRVMDKMDSHHDTYSPINEVMRLHFRFASLGELIEPLSNIMAVDHPFIPEFQLLCNRASDQLFYVFCKHHDGGGGDFRQVFRQYFVEHDPDFFNEEHWDYMNVSLKGSCSAVAFTDLLITKVESPVARGEMLFGLRLIEEHLNCDLTSVR